MQIKFAGCDISHHQGDIDFSKLKHKVDFCIIKLGGSDTASGNWYIDKRFTEYYNECKQYKIPVGCYWFAGKSSVGVERGIYEAKLVAKAIKDYQFEYPVYIDFEKGDTKSRISNTQFCTTFCDYLENKGFFVGIYASDISGFRNMLNLIDLSPYSLWVARYGRRPEYATDWHVWQHSSKGKLSGIDGNVDLDYSVIDFPKIMKRNHLNGY